MNLASDVQRSDLGPWTNPGVTRVSGCSLHQQSTSPHCAVASATQGRDVTSCELRSQGGSSDQVGQRCVRVCVCMTTRPKLGPEGTKTSEIRIREGGVAQLKAPPPEIILAKRLKNVVSATKKIKFMSSFGWGSHPLDPPEAFVSLQEICDFVSVICFPISTAVVNSQRCLDRLD